MNPHRLTWGAAYDFPFSQLVAAATIIGFLLLFSNKGDRPTVPKSPQTTALALLWIIFTISTIFSLLPEEAWPAWEKITKILLMVFFTMALIDNEKKMKYLFMVIALSIGFYGLKGGIFSIQTGGNYTIWGPGGMLEANTALGLALNMVLPMLFYLSQIETRKWVYWLLRLTFYFSIVAVVFTYSRGALLGLVAVLGLIMLRSRPAYLIFLVAILFLSIPVVLNIMPERWHDKMNSLVSYESDGSAVSRIDAWKASWYLALDRPLVGGGFNAIYDYEIYDRYHPGTLKDVAGNHKTGAHSIYFEILGESGFIGASLFLFLLLSTILNMRRIRKENAHEPRGQNYCFAAMIETGLIGYAISGAFLELATFDLFYHLVALGIIHRHFVRKKETEITKETSHDNLVNGYAANSGLGFTRKF